MVTFEARNTAKNTLYTIEKIELVNLRYQGELDISGDFTEDNVYWATDYITANYTLGLPSDGHGKYEVTISPAGSKGEYTSLTGPGDQLPVLPQGVRVGSRASCKLEAGEQPNEPGIIVTFRAFTLNYEVYPSGSRVYFPLPALYKSPDYSGKPDIDDSRIANKNAFAFQMGKRYIFRLDLDDGGYPKLVSFMLDNIPWKEVPIETDPIGGSH
jgi:hypothetical protein